MFSVALLENTNWCSIYSKNKKCRRRDFVTSSQQPYFGFTYFYRHYLTPTWFMRPLPPQPLHKVHVCCSPMFHCRKSHMNKPRLRAALVFLGILPLLFQQRSFVQKYFLFFVSVWGFLLYFSYTQDLLCQRDRASGCLRHWSSRRCNMVYDCLVVSNFILEQANIFICLGLQDPLNWHWSYQ